MTDQTNRPPNDASDLTADQLREEIAETRQELSETLDAITAKLDVKARASDKADEMKAQAAQTASQAKVQVAHAVDEARLRAVRAVDQAKLKAVHAADEAKVRVTHAADQAKHKASQAADQVKARTTGTSGQPGAAPRREGEHARSMTAADRARTQVANVTVRVRTEYRQRPVVFYVAGAVALAGALVWLGGRRR